MFMSRIVFLLLAKRLAEQRGASPDQSLRDALPALIVNPPLVGLFLAIALAQREPTAVVNAGAQIGVNKLGTAARGHALFDQLLSEEGRQGVIFPSFIGMQKDRASRILASIRLSVRFINESDDNLVVIKQDPRPGSDWKANVKLVKLTLGRDDDLP
jgi:hypothetical protein